MAFRQIHDSNPNPKSIGGYTNKQELLIIGDGDFSFSKSLGIVLSGQKMVATCFDRLEIGKQKYPKSMEKNIHGLQQMGAEVHDEVDCTKLHTYSFLKQRKFHRIVFNFPHVGGALQEDVVSNQNVLRGFFKQSHGLLMEKGQIHITLRSTLFYDSWKVEDLGKELGYQLHNTQGFVQSNFPGYTPQRTSPAVREPPSTEGAITYMFTVHPEYVKSKEIKRTRVMVKAGSTKKKITHCIVCALSFADVKKYNGHVNSAKHAKKVKASKK